MDQNKAAIFALEGHLVEAERAARAARGLPLWHVLDLNEFPFAFALKERDAYFAATAGWLIADPQNPVAARKSAYAHLACRRYAEANALFAQISPATDFKSRLRFGVPHAPRETPLPEVTGRYPTGPAFYLACDDIYFKHFGPPLLASIAANNPATPVHIHIMAARGSIVDRITATKWTVPITLTYESPLPFIEGRSMKPADYYGAVRLIRFAQALHHATGPLCMIDADSLANGDPRPLLDTPGDVAMRVRPGRIEPWHQFSACMVLGRPGARAYFDEVANIVKAHLDAPWWGLDQFALFSAWVSHMPALTLFGPDQADVSGATGTMIFTAGAAKERVMVDDTPFAQMYRKYRGAPV